MKLISLYEDIVTDSFGRDLKRALKKPEAFKILDYSCGGSFTQGGCYVLAKALHRLIPRSEVWGIYRDGGKGIAPKGYADHFVVKLGNLFYDADGVSNTETLLNRWKTIELVNNPALRKARPVDVHPNTPSEKAIVDKIRDYLLSDEALKQSLFNINK